MNTKEEQLKLEFKFTDYIANNNFINGIDGVKIAHKCAEIAYNWHLQKQLELLEEIKKENEVVSPQFIEHNSPDHFYYSGKSGHQRRINQFLDSKILLIKKELSANKVVTEFGDVIKKLGEE